MTREELIDRMAQRGQISKINADRALRSFINAVTDSLSKNESVTIKGFGTFLVARRLPRKGRNPRTGKEIRIPPKSVPKFRPGKVLKEAVALGPDPDFSTHKTKKH